MGTGEDAVGRGAAWALTTSARPGLAIGVGCGLFGLLPWLVLGERLPLQNLWRSDDPNSMPWAMVPLNQYYLPMILALLIVAGLAAGVVVRRLRRPELIPPVGLGLLALQAAALVQSFAVLVPGLRLSGLAAAYLFGLSVVCLLGVGTAQAVLGLVSSEQPQRAALGLILASAPLAQWLGAVWVRVFGPHNVPPVAFAIVQWLPGVLVGLVLVWCTLRGQRRLSTWVVGVLVAWLVPAAFDAVNFAVARNTARGGLGAVVDQALEMIRVFAGPGRQNFQGALLALGLGLVGSLGVWLVRKVRSPAQVEQR